MNSWSEITFAWANSLSGRSFTLDAIFATVVDNPVAKAGPIVACFAYVWWNKGTADILRRRRHILLLTLVSVFLLAPVMKAVSSDGFGPRPFVRAEQVYILEDSGALRPLPQVDYRPPATGDAAARHERLSEGEIDGNDFNSFPSDHAALFLTLAFGVFLASRGAGLIALAWALLCASGSRVITGLHWPLDIVAGGAIGIAFLTALILFARLLPRRLTDLPIAAAERWPGIAAAVFVLALMEVANAMNTLERAAELAGSVLGLTVA